MLVDDRAEAELERRVSGLGRGERWRGRRGGGCGGSKDTAEEREAEAGGHELCGAADRLAGDRLQTGMARLMKSAAWRGRSTVRTSGCDFGFGPSDLTAMVGVGPGGPHLAGFALGNFFLFPSLIKKTGFYLGTQTFSTFITVCFFLLEWFRQRFSLT